MRGYGIEYQEELERNNERAKWEIEWVKTEKERETETERQRVRERERKREIVRDTMRERAKKIG